MGVPTFPEEYGENRVARCLDAISRNAGLDFAFTGDGMLRSTGSCLGEDGGEMRGSATSAVVVFCSKPSEAMSSTKEGRGVDIVERFRRG